MHTLTASERQVLETIQQQPMLEQVQSWSAVNSGSGNLDGLAVTAKMLAEAFSALPGEVALVDPEPVDRVLTDGSINTVAHGQHLLVTVRADAPTQLLFTGHMDTVFPADHEFQKLRWLEDGVLNGPGVADMKGGISVMLAALHAAELSGSLARTGYQILINSDEEVGSPSSAKLIAKLSQNKLAALTYEPALPDGTLAGARGGSGNFSVIFSGLSAHAGRNPDDGRNALLAAADLALRLKLLSRDGLSVNPAKIDGGGPNNVVPDHAILRVNFRPRTPEIVKQTEADLHRIIADIEREHDVRAHLHGSFGRPPKPIDEGAAKLFGLVKQCGADLGLSIAWRSSGGVCDGNNIAACGVPVVDTMGVRGGNIHSKDEFLIVESLTERAQLSALTIMRLSEKGAL
ncbi:hydrolase [Sphingorhabdus sp.]|jgi:glutamate carboxypeptidase|uniref:hydrolase n=1 Tax=Sphingorhabdus sp. TaxID=1902408 RepID=UPI0037CADDB3